MAGGIGHSGSIVVQQALHGYSQGHRELACSARLSSKDARTMLMMSDLASAGTRVPEGGYLTAYPLAESEYYAIGRTWPAPEMSRPGCVWTHTLLIPSDQLGMLCSGDDLQAAFRRPMPSAVSQYATSTALASHNDRQANLPASADKWLRDVLFALYGHPADSIVAPSPADIEAEDVVLALWLQQPVQLRKRFAFCTFTTADRATDRLTFDLQVAPTLDRGIRSQFPNATLTTDLTAEPRSPWFDQLVQDLRSQTGSLTQRLGQYPVSTRAGVMPALRLQHLLDEIPTRPEAFSEALAILASSSLEQSVTADQLVQAIAPHAAQLDEEGFAYLMEHLHELSDVAKKEFGEVVTHAVWLRDPVRLTESPFADVVMTAATASSARKLADDQLLRAVRVNPELSSIAVSAKPEILSDYRFWACGRQFARAAMEHLHTRPDEVSASVITAAIEARNEDLVPGIVEAVGASSVLQALAPLLNRDANVSGLRSWLARATADAEAVAGVLTSGSLRSVAAITAIARMTKPDDVPTDSDVDPWLTALSTAEGTIDLHDASYLFPYLLSRALGRRTKSRSELVALSFNTVYRLAEGNAIDEGAWHLLDKQLPEVTMWLSWDRCNRLRLIGHVFAERDFEPAAFLRLTEDDTLFVEIVRLLARTKRGRSYLRRVHTLLTQGDTRKSEQTALRIQSIEALVG